MVSQPVKFEKLLNTRDLGGMTGADGRRIKPGKLFRSGHLYGASEADLEKLSQMIDVSVDFRTQQERDEKPEPAIPGVRLVQLPIFEEQQAGVTRDEDSFAEIRQKMLVDAIVSKHYMAGVYKKFIRSAFSVGQYEQFVRIMLEEHEKGVLWHCTAGKDRAGFATVIVQELLGVSRDDIEADYMLTNVCLEPEIQSLLKMFRQMPGVDPEVAAEGCLYIFSAFEDYLHTAYETVEKEYGSFDNYLSRGLHITTAERDRLREMYLETQQ